MKACVVAAAVSPNSFKDTVGSINRDAFVIDTFTVFQVKLVATTLIAGGQLDEGINLLCLAGKNQEACRYLQTCDRWEDAAWLAKVCFRADNPLISPPPLPR